MPLCFVFGWGWEGSYSLGMKILVSRRACGGGVIRCAGWGVIAGVMVSMFGVGASVASAQGVKIEEQAGLPVGVVAATRADLARAYVSLERALVAAEASGGVEEAELALLQKRFDDATVLFFSGQGDRAMRKLHALQRRIDGLQPDLADDAQAPQAMDERVLRLLSDSLSVKFEKPVTTFASEEACSVQIRSMYVLGGEADKGASAEEAWAFEKQSKHELELGVTKLDDDEVLWKQSVMVSVVPGKAISTRVELVGLREALAGMLADDEHHTLAVGFVREETGELVRESTRITIGPSLLSTVRARVDERVDKLAPLDETALDAAQLEKMNAMRLIARERATALSDTPGEFSSSDFLQDLGALAKSLEEDELPALETDQEPYAHRVGEWVMPFVVQGKNQPGAQVIECRVYAPPQAAGQVKLPVVIALHGAGGDSAMWLHAYGAGKLKELADRHGFVIVSPSTYSIALKTSLVEDLLTQVSWMYAVDEKRVSIIGHSLGAQAAVSAAWARPGVFAGCVALAGGRPPMRASTKGVPTLVVLGGQDPIMPAKELAEQWNQASNKRGVDVQVKVVASGGHTLLVTTELDQSIEWLMGKVGGR